jgi:hypothetical protein
MVLSSDVQESIWHTPNALLHIRGAMLIDASESFYKFCCLVTGSGGRAVTAGSKRLHRQWFVDLYKSLVACAEREVSNHSSTLPNEDPSSGQFAIARQASEDSMSSFNSVDTLGFVLGPTPSPTSHSPQAASSPKNEVIADKPLALQGFQARKSNAPVWAKPMSPFSEKTIFSGLRPLGLDTFARGVKTFSSRWAQFDLEELTCLAYLIDMDRDGSISWDDFYSFCSTVSDAYRMHALEVCDPQIVVLLSLFLFLFLLLFLYLSGTVIPAPLTFRLFYLIPFITGEQSFQFYSRRLSMHCSISC